MSTEHNESANFRVVHRTIVEADQELDVRPLYLSGVTSFAVQDSSSRQSGGEYDREGDKQASGTSHSSGSVEGLTGYGHVEEMGDLTVRPEKRVTFATYFNAFPAAYWRRWTDISTVRLTVRVRGEGNVVVYRSTSRGHVLREQHVAVASETSQTLTFDLSLTPFLDGGWYWMDVEAGDAELVLEEAHWAVETDRVTPGTVTIGITTFNRPDFCVNQLLNFASASPEILGLIDEIVVVDQGSQKVVDDASFERAAVALGDKLRVIEQGNLGGSGGFSRAMFEAVSKGSSDYVLLLDDDVVCELESIARAVAFADLAKSPTIVGGHMFNLYVRSTLHAYGETVGKYKWVWGPAPTTADGHDFSTRPLRTTSWLHRRVDVDYNGWWMCLIPVEVIKQIGLSMPMFIKWDDAEFGLRASRAGYPTVSLPGNAVWHVPWTEKDDRVDWQAYFHIRNRLVAALLHSPYPRGGVLVRESFLALVRHVISMQYSPAAMIIMAIEDVLDGPQRMHRDLANRLGELRDLRKGFTDAQLKPALDEFPPPRLEKPPRKGRLVVTPTGRVGKVRTALTGVVHQLKPVRPLSREHPEAAIQHVDQKWWRFMQVDSALVSSADGSAAAWYKREPRQARQLVERAAKLHARLYAEWPRLVEEYRRAQPDLTSPESWKSTFEGNHGD